MRPRTNPTVLTCLLLRGFVVRRFYLARIGCSISPLSNNTLYRALKDNPFPRLFACGLNVTLSTDDPMQFHTTSEPLVEEYTIAKQLWQLSSAELGEIANNSVRQSGFSHQWKSDALGSNYLLPGVAGNDINKSNIPDCRVAFRHENLLAEYQFIFRSSLEDPKLPVPKVDPKDGSFSRRCRLARSCVLAFE